MSLTFIFARKRGRGVKETYQYLVQTVLEENVMMLPVEKPEERDLPDLLVIFCHKQLILQHCYALLANVPTYPQERSKCSCHKMSEWIKSYIQVHGLDNYHASISVKERWIFFFKEASNHRNVWSKTSFLDDKGFVIKRMIALEFQADCMHACIVFVPISLDFLLYFKEK